MPTRYAFFTLTRVSRDRIEYPDGTHEDVLKGSGQAKVDEFNSSMERQALEAARASAESANSIDDEELDGLTGSLAARARLAAGTDRWTCPGCTYAKNSPGKSRCVVCGRRRDAAPSSEGHVGTEAPRVEASSLADVPKARLSPYRGWTAHLFRAGTWEPIGEDPPWYYGIPVELVTSTLNRLADEGWSVIQVSEDRGIYRGEDTATDSSPTTIRYMLTREE